MTSRHSRPRAVFDCMVFLQGLTSEGGPAAACLELFDDYAIELFVSKEVMAEI